MSVKDIDQSKQKIQKLVEIFSLNEQQYGQSFYKEAHVRKEFIDKFFVALGWDVSNDEGRSEKYKEVINEDAIKIGGRTKAPDYAFRIGGTKVFYVEAKKPSLNIKDDPEPAYQLRRYAWNSNIPISILTDFQEFVVYDCTMKPNPKDNPFVGRLFYFNYKSYLENFEQIWHIFSKEQVLRGNYDRYVQANKGKRETTEVDSDFLRQIEKWRNALAHNIGTKNPNLSVSGLNFCVQKILDRVLFLRICEDKGIEQYESLKDFSEGHGIYEKLLLYFERSDRKYNSGIFDLGNKNDITNNINIDDKILKEIIEDLYYPRSPYDFSVITIDILGKVYEKFLTKLVTLTKSNRIKIEDKPIIRKSGGVYYTPEYIVDYIIQNTVGKFINTRSHEEIKNIRILDPSCGSGTFLVRAYSYLLDYHLAHYLKNPKKYKSDLYQIKEGQWLLTTEVRKRILLYNIFGLDIDPQAVEITKLSLLLKVLENETKESVNQQLKLFQDRALPNIDNNIKCGNTLVDSSYFSQNILSPLDNKDLFVVNPFDWDDEKYGFGNIMKNGGFDIIIGNPPYVKEDVNRTIFELIKRTNMSKYYQGKMDYWYLFTCRSIDKLKVGGYHSFIAHNNWVTSYGASILRNKIISETKLISFFDFNEFKVFKDSEIQTMVFVLQKGDSEHHYECDYFKINDRYLTKAQLRSYLINEHDSNSIQHSKIDMKDRLSKNKTITFETEDVEEITKWMSSKSTLYLKDEQIGNGIDVLQDFVREKHLDGLKDKSIKKGDGIFVLTSKEMKSKNFNEYEMNKIMPYYTTDQLFQYYGNPNNQYWIIYADKDVRSNISMYPNIRIHLNKFKPILTSAFKPYGLHRSREQRFFEGEKILVLRKTKQMCCTFVDFPCYVSRAFMILKPNDINLKYLVGLLNSRLINYWIYHKGKRQGEQLQIDKDPLMEIPIYIPNQDQRNHLTIVDSITKNVEGIVNAYSEIIKNITQNEEIVLNKKIEIMTREIDKLVYRLYDMSEIHINRIEKWFEQKIAS